MYVGKVFYNLYVGNMAVNVRIFYKFKISFRFLYFDDVNVWKLDYNL